MNKRDEIYYAVIQEIERLGGTVEDERPASGSHRMIYWSLDGKSYLNTVPAYSGNWRSRRTAVADVRAKLRGSKS